MINISLQSKVKKETKRMHWKFWGWGDRSPWGGGNNLLMGGSPSPYWTTLYNKIILLYNEIILLYNNIMLLYNKIILFYNKSILLYNKITLLYNTSILMYNKSITLFIYHSPDHIPWQIIHTYLPSQSANFIIFSLHVYSVIYIMNRSSLSNFSLLC